MTFCGDFAQFGVAVGVKLLDVGGNNPGIFRIGTQIAHSVCVVGAALADGLSVGGAFSFEVRTVGCDTSAAHDSMTYNNSGTFSLALCLGECLGYGFGVGAVDCEHVPSPCGIFCCHILAVNCVDVGRELHAVAVIEHYEVAQAEESGDAAGSLRDFLLNAAVADEGIGLVSHNVAEAGLKETLGNGAAHGHGVTLSQRA